MRVTTIACDRCHAPDSKKSVTSYSLRRGTRRWTGELCDKCFDNLLTDWAPSDLSRARHQIIETKIEDIASV